MGFPNPGLFGIIYPYGSFVVAPNISSRPLNNFLCKALGKFFTLSYQFFLNASLVFYFR